MRLEVNITSSTIKFRLLDKLLKQWLNGLLSFYRGEHSECLNCACAQT